MNAVEMSAFDQAAYSRLRFERLTVSEGLPTNWIMTLFRDSYGFVWFGTHQGLVRYDGTNLHSYASDPDDPSTLQAPFIGMLYEDKQRRLWIGFAWANAGLALFNRECDCFQRFAPRLGFNDIRAMVQDRKGRHWVGTEDGVALFDPETGTPKLHSLRYATARTLNTPVVNALLEDRAGRLWVGSDSGLFHFHPEEGRYEPWPGRPDEPHALSGAAVWNLMEDPNGSLWVATIGAGLQNVDPESGTVKRRYLPDLEDPHSISSARVRGLARDSQGRIYAGTENHGLNVLDPATGRFARYRPSLDDVGSLNSWTSWNLLIDHEDTLWVATHNGGVNWAAPGGPQFRTLEAQRGGLSDPHVTSVIQDRRGNLWIGTDGGGLNQFDRVADRFTVYRHDPKDPTTVGSNSILAIFEDSDGDIWLGGWDAGLGLVDQKTGKITRFRHEPGDPGSIPSNHVWSVREPRKGELLVGTQAGTSLFDKARRRFRPVSDMNAAIGNGKSNDMARDASGGLWLCGYNFAGETTVLYVDAKRENVRRYGTSETDPPAGGLGVCNAVHVDTKDNVWVGSSGAIHILKAGTTEFRSWTPAPEITNDEVSNILEDDQGNIWISASARLLRIVRGVDLPADPRIDMFDRRDGFRGPLQNGAAFRSKTGEMFFGGIGGVTSFWPQNMKPNKSAPRVVLTDIKVMNRSLRPCVAGSPLAKAAPLADTLTLSYRDSVITFGFAAINYWLPQKNQYSYKLEGFDREWSDVGSKREATYTNLSPGEYTLRVRAANNDGVWSESGAALQLRITPPFWATWWFRGAVLAAVVGWALYLHRQRVQRLTLEARAEARALAVKVEERTRLARELHDTLEQALAGIRFQLSVASRNMRDTPGTAATSVEMARRMLAYCMEEARRAVMDLRSQSLEQGDLVRALSELGGRLTEATPMVVDVKVAGSYRRLEPASEHHLFRIAQEAMTNAIKHSGGNRLDVDLSYDDARMTLTIRDNGRGLRTESSPDGQHFGLQGMRERAERIGGSLSVTNAPDGGVQITVGVPVRPAPVQEVSA
jgi:signal transduction histidine kinase/ligand-binding sensor domain-containing protein